jgi:hypothetical protein
VDFTPGCDGAADSATACGCRRVLAQPPLLPVISTPAATATALTFPLPLSTPKTEAMERYHALPTTRRRIPFTNVRGASNLVHQPLGTGARRGQWTNGAVVPGHFELGYK